MSTNKLVWTAAYLRRDDGCVLVRRRGKGFDSGRIGPPGGKVEVNETLVECLRRELLEETGLTAERISLYTIYDTPRGVVFFYRVHAWSGVLQDEPGHSAWFWEPSCQLQGGNVQGGLARWLGGNPSRCHEVLR